MKPTRTHFKLLLAAICIIQGCQKNPVGTNVPPDPIPTDNYAGFDFKTVKDVNFQVKILDPQNQPFTGVYISVYYKSPLNTNATLITDASQYKIFHGVTDISGILSATVSLPTAADSLYFLVEQPGVPMLTASPVISPNIQLTIGGNGSKSTISISTIKSMLSIPTPTVVSGYYVLGSWNSVGLGSYFYSPNDVVSAKLLKDLSITLPEFTDLQTTHPEYFNGSMASGLKVQQDCDLWVSFVSEGSNWTNILGYYTYKTGSKPPTAAAIKDKTIIFPNASLTNSGGALTTGNKVQLLYLNPSTNQFQTTFPAGTTVSWFLVAKGWKGGTVTSGDYSDYSDAEYNPESDASLKQHSVLLYNKNNNVVILSFEDVRRDQGSDNDFNDEVCYTESNPSTAVSPSDYAATENATDSDNDGVIDSKDEYPNDPNRAFNNYYPAKNTVGSLAFEDLWPYKGDYDFNDLVLDYNINQVTNAQNMVVDITANVTVRAIGGSYHNAFGIAFNTPSTNVTSVTGQKNTKGYLSIASNGTENGQANATVIFFDDSYNVLPYPGTGLYVNTDPSSPYAPPQSMTVKIAFKSPIPTATLGTPPYNPFIIVNRDRGVEVHLPNTPPTSLAKSSLLGSGQDKSVPSQGKYYVSDYYLPWALNIPVSFSYPVEKIDIRQTHLKFDAWAKSLGAQYKDWYQNNSGYRNSGNIYPK